MTEPTSGDLEPRGFDSGGSMFYQASNTNIYGGTFNAYGADRMDYRMRIRLEKAMALLSSQAAHGAPYDAAAREDVPKCREHTRVAVIDGIHKWAHSQEANACPLMWMYGPAGCGKTTIMQTVAEAFDKEGSLATSFFFSKLSAARPKNKEKFVVTIAHQLSLCIPALQQPLADALSDSSILTKSLAKQLDALVIGPLNQLDSADISLRCIFLVDGLDECTDETAQRDVLSILEQILHRAHHRVRILVTSRTLSQIQAFFSQASIRNITQTTALDNDYKPDMDIMTFLVSEFGKIRNEHPARGGLPSNWPTPFHLDTLVERASGQFIYASVVMKYIADHGRHPDHSLQTIISLKTSADERPYEQLDALYAEILSTIEPQNLAYVQDIIGCLLIDADFCFGSAVQRANGFGVAVQRANSLGPVIESPDDTIDFLFMAQPGTIAARINRIYPLIQMGPCGLQFSHASFPDYLFDPSRSQTFFLDMRKVHCRLACRWFKLHDARFKSHHTGPCDANWPNGGCICSYVFPDPYSGRHGPSKGVADFQDMILHCYAAECSPELQQDILSYNFSASLQKISWSSGLENPMPDWEKTVRWLNFTFWAKENSFLSLEDANSIQVKIASAIIQLTSNKEWSTPTLKRAVAGLLTWSLYIDILDIWEIICGDFVDDGQYKDLVFYAHCFYQQDHHQILDWTWPASRIWLAKTLVPDLVMHGSYISDENLYLNMALHVAQKSVEHWKCCRNLPTMLSKAPPSLELSAIVEDLLQIPRDCLIHRGYEIIEPEKLFMAICLYLNECQVPFISNHWHKPGFDHRKWYCGICILFDPLSKENANSIELSQDPGVDPLPRPMHIIKEEAPQPLQVIAPREFIPRFPLLQIWLLWVANMVMCFFPVVA